MHTHTQTDRTDYNTLHRSFASMQCKNCEFFVGGVVWELQELIRFWWLSDHVMLAFGVRVTAALVEVCTLGVFFVCLFVWFVCMSACLLATSHKNYWSDLRENFTRDVSLDKETNVTFWKYRNLDPKFCRWIFITVGWEQFSEFCRRLAKLLTNSCELFLVVGCLTSDKLFNFSANLDSQFRSKELLVEFLPLQVWANF